MLRVLLCVTLSFTVVAQARGQDKPVPPGEAAARFKLPPGFKATLFAGEPDLVQPIAFTFDDRGRMWVVECHSYPNWDGERKDRVLILEDTDGDGQHDKRTVFLDDGRNLTGIEYGFGGIWLTSVPNLIFVPDADHDDKPDGPPVVKLDGWDLKARHNVVNGITWAPDGWLWGLNGILSISSVGKPGTPDDQRMKMNCGVWRYHPLTEKVEAVAHGTTNPWGLDFDEYGEAFITNCVIKHAFHVVPGAHFERMFGQDVNPRTYQLIPSIADHIHWGGGHWTESRSGEAHDAPGGGHAHSGAMVYLGDNWPEKYRGRLFTCNIHGNRVNQDRLERHGSSYVAKHEPDFLMANDPWFRGLAVKYGPDGGVYVADWSDTGECHNYEVADRSNGRIFKVVYGEVKPFKEDLATKTDFELVEFGKSTNGWTYAHARRLLQERAAAGKLHDETIAALQLQLGTADEPPQALRPLWMLHAVNGIDDEYRDGLLRYVTAARRGPKDEIIKIVGDWSKFNSVVAWVIRLDADRNGSQLLEGLAQRNIDLKNVHNSLAIASLAQRKVVKTDGLRHWLRQPQPPDECLSHMTWYAVEANYEALADDLPADLPQISSSLVRRNIARRLTEPSEPKFADNLERLARLVPASASKPKVYRDVAFGLFDSLDGRRNVPAPPSWRIAYVVLISDKSAEVREVGHKLALIFGDQAAIADMLKTIRSSKQLEQRQAAIAALAQGKVDVLSPVLFELLDDKELRTTALRHFAGFADPKTPDVLLAKYKSFDDEAKREAIAALAARPDWAKALLDAVEAKTIPKTSFTAYHWQQLALLKDKAILERVEKLFGNVRPTQEDRLAQIVEWKKKLPEELLATADAKHGRAVFNKSCAACHKLFDEGGNIGPELTGAQRTNLDYLLTNVIDPSAIVPRDYQMQVIATNDGRVLTGIVKEETDAVLTLQTSTSLLKLAKSDIEERTATTQSMMPEGLIQQFTFEEFRDLVSYLRAPGQVELK